MKISSVVTIIQIVLLVALISIIVSLIYPWLIMFFGVTSLPNPPQPEITYGEFPFKLVYEINGEQKVIEDTVICEYDGIGAGSNGKYRKWKSHLENSGNENVLITTDGTRDIYCYVGSADYYMNDEKYPEKKPLNPRIYDVKLDSTDMSILSREELLDRYKIKLISWKFSEPIANSFK